MSNTRTTQVTYHFHDDALSQDRDKVTVECWKSKVLWQNDLLQVVMYLSHMKDMISLPIIGKIWIFKAIISLFHVYDQCLTTKMWILI